MFNVNISSFINSKRVLVMTCFKRKGMKDVKENSWLKIKEKPKFYLLLTFTPWLSDKVIDNHINYKSFLNNKFLLIYKFTQIPLASMYILLFEIY